MILRGLDRFPTMESMLEFGCLSGMERGREGRREGRQRTKTEGEDKGEMRERQRDGKVGRQGG